MASPSLPSHYQPRVYKPAYSLEINYLRKIQPSPGLASALLFIKVLHLKARFITGFISALERTKAMFEMAIISIIGFVLLFSSTLLGTRPPKQEHGPEKYQAVRQQMKSWPW
jgi:hypothetical protein